jgi:hypothetical protein
MSVLAYGTYAAHENGRRGITLESAIKYAAFFKVSFVWLATGQLPTKGGDGPQSELADCRPKCRRRFAALFSC